MHVKLKEALALKLLVPQQLLDFDGSKRRCCDISEKAQLLRNKLIRLGMGPDAGVSCSLGRCNEILNQYNLSTTFKWRKAVVREPRKDGRNHIWVRNTL